jgi:hypothetical protein
MTTLPFHFNASANTTIPWATYNWIVSNEQNIQPGKSHNLYLLSPALKANQSL